MSDPQPIPTPGRRGATAPSVERFIAALNKGADYWREAGEILVQLRTEDEHAFERIVAAHSFVTHDMLEVFYHIGTKALHPLTPLLPKHVFAEIRRLGMSYDAQEALATRSITVVTHMDQGVAVTKSKPIGKLTQKEARYVLSRKGVATVEKQVAKLKALETAELAPPKPKVEPTPVARREPKIIGNWVVRRTPGGYCFEKTQATPYTTQRVTLLEGNAVIQLVEYK